MGISQERTAGLFPLVSRLPGLKHHALLKGKEALERRPGYIRERLDMLDCIIAPNAFMRRLYGAAGLPEEKVLLSGYGLDTDGLERTQRNSRPDEPVRFAYMGMLGQLKGVDMLIRAFLYLDDSARATLTIYGDESHFPDYVADLKSLAGNHDGVSFNGTFPPDRLGAVLSKIDVLVVPSLWYENAPLVIQSAQAAGIPVVGTNVAGITELVRDGVNGLLFPRGDEAALVACLKRFIDEPDVWTRLHENIEPVKSIENNGAELEELYVSLSYG
jgi:glycosyltransferase involved in cell wall biosynthesis